VKAFLAVAALASSTGCSLVTLGLAHSDTWKVARSQNQADALAVLQRRACDPADPLYEPNPHVDCRATFRVSERWAADRKVAIAAAARTCDPGKPCTVRGTMPLAQRMLKDDETAMRKAMGR
jgi:hypothetical protein